MFQRIVATSHLPHNLVLADLICIEVASHVSSCPLTPLDTIFGVASLPP
jgi:hypothetical protein